MEDDVYRAEQYDPTSEENRVDDLPPMDDWFGIVADIVGVGR